MRQYKRDRPKRQFYAVESCQSRSGKKYTRLVQADRSPELKKDREGNRYVLRQNEKTLEMEKVIVVPRGTLKPQTY